MATDFAPTFQKKFHEKVSEKTLSLWSTPPGVLAP